MELKYRKFKVVEGSAHKLRLALRPLKEVGEEIVADMEVEHTGNSCGICGKPFSIARRWRGLARIVFGGKFIVMFSWKLCGKCTADIKRNGGDTPECLKREAEKACEELLLAVDEPKGTA